MPYVEYSYYHRMLQLHVMYRYTVDFIGGSFVLANATFNGAVAALCVVPAFCEEVRIIC